MDLLDLPGWADEPEAHAVAAASESSDTSPALTPYAARQRRRSASVASSTFSLLVEEDGDRTSTVARGVVDESERGDEGVRAGDDDFDLGALSDAAEQLSDDLPALSFSSASECSSRSPSPAPSTPSPPDLDSLDPPDDQLLAFSRSPSPLVVDKTCLGTARPGLDALVTPSSSRSPPHQLSPFVLPSLPERTAFSPPLSTAHVPPPHLEGSDGAAAPSARPRSPTQAEMDVFFGYVGPLAPPTAVSMPELDIELSCGEGARRVGGAAGGDAAGESEGHVGGDGSDAAGRVETVSEDAEMSGAVAAAQQEPGEEARRYFQLEPLPKVSRETGLPLSKEERRCVHFSPGRPPHTSGRLARTFSLRAGSPSSTRSSASPSPSSSSSSTQSRPRRPSSSTLALSSTSRRTSR